MATYFWARLQGTVEAPPLRQLLDLTETGTQIMEERIAVK